MKADQIQIELYLGDPMGDVRVPCWLTDLIPKPQPDELAWPALWEATPEIGPVAEHAGKDPPGYLVTAGGACTERLRRSVTGFGPHYLRCPRSVLPPYVSTEPMRIMPRPRHGMGRGILRWERLRTDMGEDWDELPESRRNRRACVLVDLRVARPRACPAVSLPDDPVPSATTRIVGKPCCVTLPSTAALSARLEIIVGRATALLESASCRRPHHG